MPDQVRHDGFVTFYETIKLQTKKTGIKRYRMYQLEHLAVVVFLPPPTYARLSLRISCNRLGLALPWDSFMACPTRNPIDFLFPFL